MRLVTLSGTDRHRPGVMADDAILDLAACVRVVPELGPCSASVRALIELGSTGLDLVRRTLDRAITDPALRDRLHEAGALISATQAELAAPLPDPRLMLFCGVNYRKHILEMGGKLPETPVAFLKSPHTVIGPGDAIVLPPSHPNMVDWEAEFSAVIGRPCHGASVEDALDYVVGYTMINDVSARDWAAPMMRPDIGAREAMKAWEDNIHGKQFPTFSPMGPCLALKDEIVDPANVSFWLKVNGRTMQAANTDDLVFNVAELIAWFSRIYRLMPGDIVTTGSPSGVGMGRRPPVFLQRGDVIELGAAGIGAMTNTVQ